MTNHPVKISLEETNRLYACVACWAVQQGLTTHKVWQGETDEWRVTFSMADRREVNSFKLTHKRLVAVAVVEAKGGAIVGADEDDVIAHFHGLLTEPLFPSGPAADV